MAAAGGYVLRVEGERRRVLREAMAEGRSPGEPVPKFAHSRNAALVVFGCLEDGAITHIANGRVGTSAGTGMVRLNLDEMEELADPVPIDRLIASVPNNVRHHVQRVFAKGGLLPSKSLAAVVDVLLSQVPDLRKRLARFGAARAEALARLSEKANENLALQKETLTVALKIAGLSREEILTWTPGAAPHNNFLEGLDQVYVREDPMVISDLGTVPGFSVVREYPFAAKEFVDERNPRNKLTVIMTNRTALEEQTGADLIYYNRTHGCFIMVQYKAMIEGEPPTFRWKAGDDLDKEIGRMDAMAQELAKCPPDNTPRGFRFSEEPFFLKICRRILLNPDSKDLFPGMYFPLALWKRVAADPATLGSKGGRYLTFANAGRRLSNSEFVNLVRGGWIGTTLPQAVVMEKLVRSALQDGKAVTFAVKDDAPPPPDAPAAEDFGYVDQPDDEPQEERAVLLQ